MEKVNNLKARQAAVLQALSCLQESLEFMEKNQETTQMYRLMRNSAIQCFEFSVDTFWKLLKVLIETHHGLTLENPSPNKIFRTTLNLGLIDNVEFVALTDMVEDRNITSHTYNEDLAQDVSSRLSHYHAILQAIMSRLRIR